MIKLYLLFSFLLLPAYALSQITGNVFCKQTANPLPGAEIKLAKNGKATNIKTTTDANGVFTIAKPSPGTYQVWVNCKGYIFYSYELIVYRQVPKQVLSPIELEKISPGP